MTHSGRIVVSSRDGRAIGGVAAAVLAISCLASGIANGQTLLWHFDDNCADLDLMGDVDGDGVNDVVADAQKLSAVVVLSGVDGHTIKTYSTGGSVTGFTVAGVGDVNGDGSLDLAYGDPLFPDSHGAPVGYVTLLSGSSGATLYHYQGKNYRFSGYYEEAVGTCIRGILDGDGDGHSDFVWGMWVDPTFFNFGPSKVVGEHYKSGTEFSLDLLGNFVGGGYSHAHSLAPTGDVDGDGLADFAAGSIQYAQAGQIELRSGSNGALIRTISGASQSEDFGYSVAACEDLDGDGTRDLLVGAIGDATNGTDAGRVDVYSGGTGTLLLQLFGDVAGQYFGIDVDGLRDVDGDGLADLLVASYGTSGSVGGRIELFSGATGRLLMRIDDAAYRIRGMGDLDGDGIDDFVVTPDENSLHAWKVDLAPTIGSVSPSRIRYDHVGSLAITGAGFTADPNLAVLIDGTPATNVVVTSYTDLTCDAPAGLLPGPHDVTVTDKFGSATLAGGLLLTPAMFIDGDPTIGSRVYLRYEFDPLDSTFAIYGLPPQKSIATPPFGGLLGIVPFFPLFTLKSFPSDEFIVHADIPNDPALSGVTVLFQSLTGPNFTGSGKDAAWSNVASITIH